MKSGILAGCLVAVVAGALALTIQARAGAAPAQPILFSHRLHAEMQVDCSYCHPLAAGHAAAGIPRIGQCAGCHVAGRSASPEIQKIHRFLDAGREIPWVRVAELTRYNIFTHEEHLEAGIDCAVCHGKVASMDRTRLTVDLDMEWCIDCHEDRGASTDCLTCHK